MTNTARTPARFTIGDIKPEPSDEVLAVITAALDTAWPEPVVPDQWRPRPEEEMWRLARRRWPSAQTSRSTWRARR